MRRELRAGYVDRRGFVVDLDDIQVLVLCASPKTCFLRESIVFLLLRPHVGHMLD